MKKESDSVKTENESVKPEGDEVKVEVLSDTDSIPEEPDNLITTVTHIHQIPKTSMMKMLIFSVKWTLI